MSINHGEKIDGFKERGRVAMSENLHKYKFSDAWINYFWHITINLVSDDIYNGLVSKFFCNNVIHPCALCLCL
jgi:hypothetical protein